ncbi:MAG: ATP-binding SpoIIE family protein phosphatase [Fibrobacterota bacterium]
MHIPDNNESAGTLDSKAQQADGFCIKEDLILCRQIQRAMVPVSFPAVAGIDMKALYIPSEAVAGDLYDIIHISEDLLALYAFDVARYGLISSLLSAMVKASFTTHVRSVHRPAAVLDRVNADLIRNISASIYVTAFVAFIDLHSNKLTWCNAGHPYPLVFRRKKNGLVMLKSGGAMLGVVKDACFEEGYVHLYPGDWLLVYTNGLYSLLQPDKDAASGHQRLTKTLKREQTSPPQFFDLMYKTYNTLKGRGVEFSDDICAFSVEVLTQSRRNQLKEKLGFDRDDPVHLQFISYYEEMDRAAGVVLRDMDAAGFIDDSIRKMKITLTELMANGIGHGNGEDHTRKVTIGHMVDKNVTVVSVMDEGEGFDPTTVPDPTLPENLGKDHGRGLFIVRNYVDEMEHNNAGNRILIRKFNA